MPGRGVHLIVFDLVARELKIGVAKERRKRQALERRNNTLEVQLQAIQDSRSWKVIKSLSYVESKVLRR